MSVSDFLVDAKSPTIVVGSNAAAMDVLSASDVAIALTNRQYSLADEINVKCHYPMNGSKIILENGSWYDTNTNTLYINKNILSDYKLIKYDDEYYTYLSNETKVIKENTDYNGLYFSKILEASGYNDITDKYIANVNNITIKINETKLVDNKLVKVLDIYRTLDNEGYIKCEIYNNITENCNVSDYNSSILKIENYKLDYTIDNNEAVIVKSKNIKDLNITDKIYKKTIYKAPIVKLDTECDLSTSDLILIGGPVVNKLTAELQNASKISINNSSPAILKVVEYNNNNILVVAGGDREKTKEAALKLIDMI